MKAIRGKGLRLRRKAREHEGGRGRKVAIICILAAFLLSSLLALMPSAASAKTGHWEIDAGSTTSNAGYMTYKYHFVEKDGDKDKIVSGSEGSVTIPQEMKDTLMSKLKEGGSFTYPGTDNKNATFKTPDASSGYDVEDTAQITSKDAWNSGEQTGTGGGTRDEESSKPASVNEWIKNSLLKPLYTSCVDFTVGTLQQAVKFAQDGVDDLDKALPSGADRRFSTVSDDAGAEIPMHELIFFVKRVYAALSPVAGTFLAILFLIQAIRVIQEPDSGAGQVPYVERFGWLWIKFAVLKFFFDNSMDVTAAVFNQIAGVTSVLSFAPSGADIGDTAKEALMQYWSNTQGMGGAIVIALVVGLLGLLLSVFMSVMVYMSTYARWMQLFIYMPFAPLAFSCLALDETRQVFWSYLKSILGMALAFLITCVILKSMPSVIAGAFQSITGGTDMASLFKIVAYEGLYVYTLMKCGSWAHDIIGG